MLLPFRDLSGKAVHQHVEYPSPIPLYKSAGQEEWATFLKELFSGEVLFEEFYVQCLGLRFDFYLPHRKIMVEIDGRQHQQYNKFFHHSEVGYARARINDQRKDEWCKINGINLFRVVKDNDQAQRNALLRIKHGRQRS